jgi:hypothetical protein
MQAIKATYNGKVFVPFTQINLPANKTVYLTLAEEESKDQRNIGILDGKASFHVSGDGKMTTEEFLGL